MTHIFHAIINVKLNFHLKYLNKIIMLIKNIILYYVYCVLRLINNNKIKIEFSIVINDLIYLSIECINLNLKMSAF